VGENSINKTITIPITTDLYCYESTPKESSTFVVTNVLTASAFTV